MISLFGTILASDNFSSICLYVRVRGVRVRNSHFLFLSFCYFKILKFSNFRAFFHSIAKARAPARLKENNRAFATVILLARGRYERSFVLSQTQSTL